MNQDELFMQRCFDLAVLGAGHVSPNPAVGAVLVYRGRIIGEGFHQEYGEAHAEVNAVNSVRAQDRHLIARSTLYVSLEPCCVYGKTPPCTNLIISQKIPEVVISCLDDSPGVNGRGVDLLRQAGVKVRVGIREADGRRLSQIRRTYVVKGRPFVILKFARTVHGFFAPPDHRQFWISNPWSKRLVHKWRSETDAILVGTRTALIDNPQLTNRLYFGRSPRRIVLDRRLSLPAGLCLFDGSTPTHVITEQPAPPVSSPGTFYHQLTFSDDSFLPALLKELAELHISSVIVEGGVTLLSGFIKAGLWDEARVLVGQAELPDGIPAPLLPSPAIRRYRIGNDQLLIYRNEKPE